MFTRFRHRLLTSFVAFIHVVFSTMLVLPASVNAQSAIDPDPPVIEHDRIAEGVIGDSQVFSATVLDDVGVETVVLQYRFEASAPYQSLDMRKIGSTDIFSVSIETQATGAKIIQYYIEARDAAGNRSIRGFAFDPLERDLVKGSGSPAVATVTTTGPSEAPAATGMSTGRKVLYGVLGLVVVGALAAAAGGGDSDDGDGGSTGVPVTITVDQP